MARISITIDPQLKIDLEHMAKAIIDHLMVK